MDNLNEVFAKMEKEGHNTVNSIVKLIQDSKIIDQTKEAEEKAIAMFSDVKENEKVTLKQFQDVMTKIAEEQKKNIDEVSKSVVKESEVFFRAFTAGVQAFKDEYFKEK